MQVEDIEQKWNRKHANDPRDYCAGADQPEQAFGLAKIKQAARQSPKFQVDDIHKGANPHKEGKNDLKSMLGHGFQG